MTLTKLAIVPTQHNSLTRRHTIGLLVQSGADRRLLSAFVEQHGYVAVPLDAQVHDPEIFKDVSLVIADEAIARRHGQKLLTFKWRCGVFLPLLVMLPPKAGSAGWLEAGFDDVLRLPLTKAELTARLRFLLRLREQAEAQYQAIFEHAPIGIFRTTLTGSLLLANPALLQMLDHGSVSDLAERDLNNLIAEMGFPLEWTNTQLEKVGQVQGIETTWTRRDGKTLDLRLNISTVLNPEGQPLYFEGTAEDITSRKRAAEAVREQEALLSGVLRSLVEEVAVIDQAGNIVRVNQTWEEFATNNDGEPSSLGAGTNYLEPLEQAAKLGDEWAQQSLAGIRQVLSEERKAFSLEYPCHSPTEERWFLMSVSPLLDHTGGAVITHLNVTERVRAEHTLRASEQRFRSLIENSADGIALLEIDGTIQYISSSTLRILGYVSEELVGRSILEFVHPDDVDYTLRQALEVVQNPGGSVTFQHRLRHKDGSWRWIEASDQNLLHEPYLEAIVVNYRDVTTRREADERIQFQANLLNTVGQAVIATDMDGRILYWNRFAETLYGWSANEVLGRSIIDVTPSQTSQTQALELLDTLTAGENWSGEFLVQRRDGTDFPAFVTDSPIHDEQGNLIGIVGVSSDITDLKEAEAALQEANERAIREYQQLLVRIAGLAQQVGTADDLVTVCRALVSFVQTSAPCNGIFVALYDAEQQQRTCIYAWSEGEEEEVSDLPPLPMTGSPNSRAAATGEIIVTDDFEAATANLPRIDLSMDTNPAVPRSSIAVPMKVLGRVIGTVEVQSVEPDAYGDEHVTAMRLAGNLAAIAIDNLQWLNREREQRLLAEALRDTAEALATTLHLDEVLDRILANIERVVPHDAASIMLIDQNVARIVRSRGFAEDGLEQAVLNQSFMIDEVELREMVETGQPTIIADIQLDERWVDLGLSPWQRSYLGVPIRSKGSVLGVLNLDSATVNFFTPEHAQRLRVLADQAGAAIENARLLQQTDDACSGSCRRKRLTAQR